MKLSIFIITLATVIYCANAHKNRLTRSSASAPAVLATYSDGTKKYCKFQECIPFPEPHSSAIMVEATFLQSVTCYPHSAPDCSGSITPPVGVAYPAGLSIPNAVDFVQLLAQAMKCYPNPLPGLPFKNFTGSVA